MPFEAHQRFCVALERKSQASVDSPVTFRTLSGCPRPGPIFAAVSHSLISAPFSVDEARILTPALAFSSTRITAATSTCV
ncbi:hypothetical protein EXIGLDRAFT_717052, partial [Exidia glandulosa HHB12029]